MDGTNIELNKSNIDGPTMSTHFDAASKELELHLGGRPEEVDESELMSAFLKLKALVDGATRTAASTETIEISWSMDVFEELQQPRVADIDRVLRSAEGILSR